MLTNETIQTILNRRSYNAFDSRPIGTEELETILEAAKYAPSGMNRQPWHFTVIQSPEMLSRIGEAIESCFEDLKARGVFPKDNQHGGHLKNASLIIIVSGDEKIDMANFACCLAMENMFLAAASLGIGSCWSGVITKDVLVKEELAGLRKELIPDGYIPYAASFFGYPGVPRERKPRKEGTISIF